MRGVRTNDVCTGGVRHPDAALIQIESNGTAKAAQEPEVVSSTAPAVDDFEIAASRAQVGDDRCDELAESSKPEVSRFGTTRQLERVAHRAAVGRRPGVSRPEPYSRR